MRRVLPVVVLLLLTAVAASAPAAAQAPAALTARTAGTALSGEPIVVRGRLAPAVGGERVSVALLRGRRVVRSAAARTDAAGRWTVRIAAGRSGSVRVLPGHAASPAVPALLGRPARVRVVRPSAAAGARGASVRFLQARLAALRYAVPRTGVLDAATARAVLAFRKVGRMARTSSANRAVFRRLARGAGAYRPRVRTARRHVEGDLARQVLALVGPKGRVERVYSMSSGAASTPTVLGTFRVIRKEPGVNNVGMVNSSYFIGGYAIHGYGSVPTYPASHGCLRVPIPDSLRIYRWLTPGTRVDVFARR